MEYLLGMWILPILLYLMTRSSILTEAFDNIPDLGYRDYCQSEFFNVSCEVGQVILMEHGVYGRMRGGRCITGNYGQAGCSQDVLPFLHKRCSGQRACKVYIAEPALHDLNPCPKDLTPYLEAKHTCVPVTGADPSIFHGDCRHGNTLEVAATSQPGYISPLGDLAGLGTARCPWTLKAQEGQTIHLTLLAFGGIGSGGDDDHVSQYTNECYDIGFVMETNSKKKILLCLSRRTDLFFRSTTNEVTVELSSSEMLQTVGTFLIKYQAVGCPKIKPPAGGWVRSEGSTAEVHCNNSQDTWYLTCTGNEWEGRVGNCSQTGNTKSQMGFMDSETNFPYGILIVVAIGVALGVFIGGLLLSLAAIYMKRKNKPYADPGELMPSMEAAYGTHIRSSPHDPDGNMIFKDGAEHFREHQIFEESSQNILCPKHDILYGRQCSQHSYNGTMSLKSGHFYESPQMG